MYIAKAAAQAIVEEIGNEIHAHVNLMDDSGCIIASTDTYRIGGVHEGARRIILENLTELYVSEEMENESTRKGINLPLVVQGEIVGVVGITGERENVVHYGNIVRRMTEIMIEDSIRRDNKRYDNRVRYRYIEEWLENPGNVHSASFVERGLALGIDVRRQYRVVVLKFTDYSSLCDTLDGQKLLEEMEATVRHYMGREKQPYLRQPNRQICFFSKAENTVVSGKAGKIIDLIKKKYGQSVAAGIDGVLGSKTDIGSRVHEAEMAVECAPLWDQKIICYDDLDMDLFLHEIRESTMREYLDKFFYRFSPDKLDEAMTLIEQYFIYDGSIGKMSEALYLHKNTLQYKFRKITELTGKDIRQPSCHAFYYMALLFYRKTQR